MTFLTNKESKNPMMDQPLFLPRCCAKIRLHSSRGSHWNSFQLRRHHTLQYDPSHLFCTTSTAWRAHFLLPVMAFHSFSTKCLISVLSCFVYFHFVSAITSSTYQLDTEYSGINFFEGWDFFTVRIFTSGPHILLC